MRCRRALKMSEGDKLFNITYSVKPLKIEGLNKDSIFGSTSSQENASKLNLGPAIYFDMQPNLALAKQFEDALNGKNEN